MSRDQKVHSPAAHLFAVDNVRGQRVEIPKLTQLIEKDQSAPAKGQQVPSLTKMSGGRGLF